jgi:hypothetical protein
MLADTHAGFYDEKPACFVNDNSTGVRQATAYFGSSKASGNFERIQCCRDRWTRFWDGLATGCLPFQLAIRLEYEQPVRSKRQVATYQVPITPPEPKYYSDA